MGRDAVEAGNVGGLETARFGSAARVFRIERQGFDFAAAGEDGRDVELPNPA